MSISGNPGGRLRVLFVVALLACWIPVAACGFHVTLVGIAFLDAVWY
jgi:hypothetical protein